MDNIYVYQGCCKAKVESFANLKPLFRFTKASFKNQRSDADTGHPLEMTCSVLKKPEGDTNTVGRIVGLVISV